MTNKDYSSNLNDVLKYAVGSDTPNQLKAVNIVNKLVRRHSNFEPTADEPHPHQHLQPAEREHYNDLIRSVDPAYFSKADVLYPDDAHDLSAVIAGTKPAALVDSNFANNHFVGKELLKRAKAAGHSFLPVNSAGASSIAVGNPDAVAKIKRSFQMGDSEESDRMLKEGLGIPAKSRVTSAAELYRRR